MAKYWIKLYHEILDDPKMCRLPDTLYRRVTELFLLAGRMDDSGNLPPTDDIAWHLRLDPDKLQPELEAIEYLTGIIGRTDTGWIVTNFSKRQDAETDADRKRYQRERDRKETLIVTKRDSNVTQNVTESVTTGVRELELDKELKLELESGAPSDAFNSLVSHFETTFGFPIAPIEDNIKTLNAWVQDGIEPQDLTDTAAFYSSNGRTARSPAQIDKSVRTAHAKRVQAESKSSAPVIDPRTLASEVYG